MFRHNKIRWMGEQPIGDEPVRLSPPRRFSFSADSFRAPSRVVGSEVVQMAVFRDVQSCNDSFHFAAETQHPFAPDEKTRDLQLTPQIPREPAKRARTPERSQ